MGSRIFGDTEQLQEFLEGAAEPDIQVVVPHQRLAQQLWHRQRLAAARETRAAWQPLPLLTLQAWLTELFAASWPRVVLAPPLVRLALWRRALQVAPAPPGPTSELTWAQSLDETHGLLCRHGLLNRSPEPGESSLVTWRRRVSEVYGGLLREGGWITPGELPAYLGERLRQGKLRLPPRLLVVGLETPAPAEARFLEEVGRRIEMTQVQVRGHKEVVRRAVALPDPAQEVAWVGAQLLELAQKFPLHALAVTAPEMERYSGPLAQMLGDLLGPPGSALGWAYNFSQGPRLEETPLFQAALYPWRFIVGGERREDLVTLLLSPYYGRFQEHRGKLATWDRVWREGRVEDGWGRLKKVLARRLAPGLELDLLDHLNRLFASLRNFRGPAEEGLEILRACWQGLDFPWELNEAETVQWRRLQQLLPELDLALGPEDLTAAELLEWLSVGARRMVLPGPGVQSAGIQVLGLLETRGLFFDRVFCLGMNSGALPAPPRPLPLLTGAEKQEILGGTFASQHRFSREIWENLLGTTPHLTLTRPLVVDQEDRVSTPFYLGRWDEAAMPILSVPHPAWLRVPAVAAVFAFPEPVAEASAAGNLVDLALPAELSLSQVRTALECPGRFFLETLLRLQELPEIVPGLDPRERGQSLHEVLALFTSRFNEILEREGSWQQDQALELLAAVAQEVIGPRLVDAHWQAEHDRWLGPHGLLREWLALEAARFREGWRWQGMEVEFAGLRGTDWEFSLRGRIDRLDRHGETGEVCVWDYKSGQIPSARTVFTEQEEFQLPCYLLAVRHGRAGGGQETGGLTAGFIGLKSLKAQHLKHEDFGAGADDWQRLTTAFEGRLADLGKRLAAGDFLPHPAPAPAGKDWGACQYCGFRLICGYLHPVDGEVEEVDDQE